MSDERMANEQQTNKEQTNDDWKTKERWTKSGIETRNRINKGYQRFQKSNNSINQNVPRIKFFIEIDLFFYEILKFSQV